jgi:hypothetical protein
MLTYNCEVVGAMLYKSYRFYITSCNNEASPLTATSHKTDVSRQLKRESLVSLIKACFIIDAVDVTCILLNFWLGDLGVQGLGLCGGAGLLGMTLAFTALRCS